MAISTRRLTIEEFDRIVILPENSEKKLEYIGGEIVEVVSNNYASEIAARVLIKIGIYLESNPIGRLTGADGGYQVSGDRYIPDVAFISKAKQPQPSHEAYNSNAPDLAVEVVSPTDAQRNITDKVVNYLKAGTVVWIVYPEDKEVKVYEPNQPIKTLTVDNTLDGGSVLPGFKLVLKDIFEA